MWTWEYPASDVLTRDTFETRDEAIEVGLNTARDEGDYDYIVIYEIEMKKVPKIDTDWVLEKIDENHNEDLHPCCEEFLFEDAPTKELDRELNKVFQKWCKENRIESKCFIATNTGEEIEVLF